MPTARVGMPAPLADRFGQMHLVAGAGRDLLQRRVAAAGAADIGDARCLQRLRDLDAFVDVKPPSTQSLTERRAPSISSGHRARDGLGDLDDEPHAVLQRAAPAVGALVGERRQELVQQVAMRAVQLDEVEAGALGAPGAPRRTGRSGPRSRPRSARAARASPRRRRWPRPRRSARDPRSAAAGRRLPRAAGGGLAAGMGELHAELGAGGATRRAASSVRLAAASLCVGIEPEAAMA